MTNRSLLPAAAGRVPVFEPSRSVGLIALVIAKRAQLAQIVSDMEAGLRDLRTYSAEGRSNAECAIVWASGLLLADGVRAILTSFDKRSAALFRAQDHAIDQAEKIMKFFGRRGLVHRKDALKTVNGALQPFAKSIATVRSARSWLKEHGAKAPPQTERLLDIGLTITADVVFILDGFKERDNAMRRGATQEAQYAQRLATVKSKIKQLDAEYARLVMLGELLSRTA